MWTLFDKVFTRRLWLGTAAYPSLALMKEAILAAQTEVITVSLKRHTPQGNAPFNDFYAMLKTLPCAVLPNTAGCRDAQAAVTTAEMARELFNTSWIKLEVIGDDFNLQPDPFELIKAAKELVQRGFQVFPYCTEDFVLCKRLIDVGCQILMPWCAPIGSGRGLLNPYALQTLRERLPDIPLIIDAGVGKPSDATQVMEMGFDGVLLNTAIAHAQNPVLMAEAFRDAVSSGRAAFLAGIAPQRRSAVPSTPLIDTPFWHQGQS